MPSESPMPSSSSSTSSSSSSSSSPASRPRRRRWTRQQLQKSLQILGPTQLPLPSQLPPSPPPSRSASPAPGHKRKPSTASEQESSKRARTSSELSNHRTEPPPLPPQHHRVTPDSIPSSVSVPPPPSQDLAASSPHLSAVPIRRPRRGTSSPADLEGIHVKYHNAGRLLKYSGDARFWSTYPPSHREYKPLANPPPPNSSYHKYGGIIARLELIDALVCFTYAMWAKDTSKKSCNFDNWKTIDGFLSWCKSKWKAEEQRTEPELAFLGLIFMIESFIETRKAFFAAKMVATKMGQVLDKLAQTAMSACAAVENGAGVTKHLAGPQGTPPMLPSPASIGPSPSSHSTPSSHGDGTPNGTVRPAPARAPLPHHPRPLPSAVMDTVTKRRGKPIPIEAYPALENISCTLEPRAITEISQFTSHVANAGYNMNSSQETLSLGVMARAFPKTFARMIHSTLTHADELEPDFEDEEGELFWPGQCITGEGLGWVCLMGRAMVYEYGKNYGYQGLSAAVPKPDVSHTSR